MNLEEAATTAIGNSPHDNRVECGDNVDISTRRIRQRKRETRSVFRPPVADTMVDWGELLDVCGHQKLQVMMICPTWYHGLKV